MNFTSLCMLAALPFLTSCAASSTPRLLSATTRPFEGHFDETCTSGFASKMDGRAVAVLAKQMGGRDHRIWHSFWHATRNSWHQFTPEQQDFFLQLDPRWEVPRVLGAPAGAAASLATDPNRNGAGEDFLYMHHSMMGEFFGALARAKLPCPEPWVEIPRANDPAWPIEKSRADKDEKSEAAFKQMDAWRKQFQSAKYLKGKTLGQVGYQLENSLHNNLHMRFATYDPPAGFSDRPEITPASLSSGLAAFDAPAYDWLADSYSAHVNPIFWKLHGMVENVLFAWLRANRYEEISLSCDGRAACYEWKGTWEGASPMPALRSGPGSPGDHDHHQGADTFAKDFRDAYEQFVNQPLLRGPAPGGKPAPSPEIERQRRRKALAQAFSILRARSKMDRGRLNAERLKDFDKTGPISAEEFLRDLDANP